ncbi:hypothetical protein [Natrarchaeobius oligotrophus]|uniref:PhiH1 repressor n=1 Tax=Natrarchaeobius chitinivorans TaxID=1679083 RepID=A0A3N6PK48_NATCH|nr:hypothetical protein [Natrarchaeobius chitinivorans]RQG99025.1 hypothetical protein EA472_15925 [Natrarchaeobius chitinivorans]
MSVDTPEWMEPVDVEILELMRTEDVFAPNHVEEADICRGPHAAYRCRELTKRDLLKKYAPGMYDITDRGERFLDGDLEASDPESSDE